MVGCTSVLGTVTGRNFMRLPVLAGKYQDKFHWKTSQHSLASDHQSGEATVTCMGLMCGCRDGWVGFKERRRYHADKEEQIWLIFKEKTTLKTKIGNPGGVGVLLLCHPFLL